VVRIVLSRTPTDDSDASVPVTISYSATRKPCPFPAPKKNNKPNGYRYAPRLKVVGSSSEDGRPGT
jgi:hypothetical protein